MWTIDPIPLFGLFVLGDFSFLHRGVACVAVWLAAGGLCGCGKIVRAAWRSHGGGLVRFDYLPWNLA
jgi:hypothetical protein